MAAGVLIIGAGGFGQSVADALAAQHAVAGFVEDRANLHAWVLGIPVLGRVCDLATLRQRRDMIVVAIGDNQLRRSLSEAALALYYRLVAVVHPRASCSMHADIGDGAMVMAGAVVGTLVKAGRGAIVNAAAVVDHHASVVISRIWVLVPAWLAVPYWAKARGCRKAPCCAPGKPCRRTRW